MKIKTLTIGYDSAKKAKNEKMVSDMKLNGF